LPELQRQLPEYLEHPPYSCYNAKVLEAVAIDLEAVAIALEAVARVQNPSVKVEYSSY
jgi:hypothetical protein